MAAITTKLLFSLLSQCAADVAPETLLSLIGVESSRNPYAIAVVYDKNTPEEKRLNFKQPSTEQEAKNIISALNAEPVIYKSYSVGLMQVNSTNFKKYGITEANMFNACKNIEAGAGIFKSCYSEAQKNNPNKNEQELLRIASSCYYSGNERRGFVKEKNGSSYVDRINATVAKNYKVPAMKPLTGADSYAPATTEATATVSTEAPQNNQLLPPKKVKSWDIFEDYPTN
ncbi:lytic transglycosylase domain-containing protein [Rodentibacter caecimuris]|uniref:lytic transglycosylase domain-containing protein n=1 Tax=Rodentibacter caecimuris TaxID=1796644 RepID=UPI00211A3BC4|nr:lytic transglycosylase domain-containing protein [Rodentibacter heylii]MCQ9124679.1 lytic transglycosylase domain-containing protein [Rodentibacter heylii]